MSEDIGATIVTRITDSLAWLALGCGIYLPTIGILTAVTMAVLALVILRIHQEVLPEEKWLKYFGISFLLFTAQYALQGGTAWAESRGIALAIIHPLRQAAQVLGSPANNLFFLATARALLGRSKSFPLWAVVTAILANVIGLGQNTFWGRFPDAAFSFYCLLYLGWAMFVNFGPKKHRAAASINLAAAACYGALNLVYAANPLIASGRLWPALASTLDRQIAEFGRSAFIAPRTTIEALDALAFSLTFLLKISLFVSVLLLIIQILVVLSPQSARGLLDKIKKRRGRFLSARGILKAVAESVDADLAEICIRYPEIKDEKVTWWRWLRETDSGKRERSVEEETVLPLAAQSIVARVMREGLNEMTCPDLYKDRRARKNYYEFAPGMRSLVAVPIWYHGSVIACLNLEWRRRQGYSATTVQRIHQIAEIIAPTVSTQRQLNALLRLAEELRSLKTKPEMELGSMEALARTVQDKLSPLATGVLLDFGFRTVWVGCNDEHCLLSSSARDGGDIGVSHRERLRQIATVRKDERPILRNADLIVQDIVMGKLVLAIAPGKDPVTRPSLADPLILRRAVAAFLANAILGGVEDELNAILHRLQVELSDAPTTEVEPWRRLIAQAARQAGLLWTVVSYREDGKLTYLGDADNERLIRSLAAGPEEGAAGEYGIQLYEPQDEANPAHKVVTLPLGDVEGHLWLGVERAGFGKELSFSSPWHTFLKGLAQAASSALARIERHRQQLAAKQFENVAMRVETTGLLMHTLGNDATTLLQSAERLEEMLAASQIPESMRRKVSAIGQAAQSFRSLTTVFRQEVPADHRQKILLVEAIDRVKVLYEDTFHANGIELVTEVPSDFEVQIPIDAAYVAIITLVVNAAEAVRKNGRIRIYTELTSGRPCCHIEDDGPGISAEMTKLLFNGFSTKPSGRGVGLSLARSSMRRCGGDIELTSRQSPTRFTIYFPQ